METFRKCTQETIVPLAVTELKRIHEYEKAAGLQNPRQLAGYRAAHFRRQLVKKKNRSHDVEAHIGQRQTLGVGAHERDLIRANVGRRLLHIGRGKIAAPDRKPRKRFLHETQKAAGAAGSIQESQAALVPPAHKLEDRRKALAAHRIG